MMGDINRAYSWAIQTCNAPNIGYSQYYRNQQVHGGVTYYDCSSFINYALLAGGFTTPNYAPNNNSFTCDTEPAELLRLGFVEVSASGEYKAGDIGISPEHTEMCYQGGQGEGTFMGAHNPNVPLNDQVSISQYTRTFPRVFRYGGGATPTGYSLYVISAICGNFWQESNINPAIWESLTPANWTDDYHGYGLGQWTNVGASRRLEDLYTWLVSNNYSITDGDAQCDYIVQENYWLAKPEYPQYTTLNTFLNSNSTDIAELTHAFNWCWEGIHDSSWDERVTRAQQIYNYILAHANDTSITQWITGNRYLSDNERLNNAVMMYRHLSAGGGGGGTPSKPHRKMPLWMKIRYF